MSKHYDQNCTAFRKDQDGKVLHCTLEVFPDGSAYLQGDEIEVIFEESPKALDAAMAYLHELGYTRVLSGMQSD